jgi:sugar lactone lactonase YvrE
MEKLGQYTVLHSFGFDAFGIHGGIHGMCKDSSGKIYACAGSTNSSVQPTIYVFSAQGQLIEGIPFTHGIPLRATFTNDESGKLFITSSDRCIYQTTI